MGLVLGIVDYGSLLVCSEPYSSNCISVLKNFKLAKCGIGSNTNTQLVLGYHYLICDRPTCSEICSELLVDSIPVVTFAVS